MRLPGYCSACNRPRTVRVSGHAIAMARATGGVAEGVCDDCEQREDDRRWLRARRGAREVLDAVARSRKPVGLDAIELKRLDRKHLAPTLRALTERRLLIRSRGATPAYQATPRGLTALRS